MNIEDLQSICKKPKGVTQDIKWEDHLCFNVGGKMFLITSPDSFPHSASFKVTDEDLLSLLLKKDLYRLHIFRDINGFMLTI